MVVRMASADDVEALVKIRFDYFDADHMEISAGKKALIESNLRRYYPSHLNKDFYAAFAEVDGGIASVAFLAISEKPANPSFPTGKVGTVLNVLTYPAHRGKGYATAALNAIVDKAREQNCSTIELSASEMGKSLYQKLGFREKGASHYTEMKLSLL